MLQRPQASPLAHDEIVFTVSVDVEEGWDWTKALPTSNFNTANAEHLCGFHQFLLSLQAAATYFCTYAMLDDKGSCWHLNQLAKNDRVEMAAHLHPWCNPPFNEGGQGTISDHDSYLFHLPKQVVHAKVKALKQKFIDCLGAEPKSFRSGRWGTSREVLAILAEEDFDVDSSLLAFYATEYFDCGSLPSQPHYADTTQQNGAPNSNLAKNKSLISMPASGGYAGFFSKPSFNKAHARQKRFNHLIGRKIQASAIASKLGLQKQIFLSPELSTLKDMRSLCNRMLAQGDWFFHLSLHSSSLEPGKNQYVHCEADKQRLYDRIAGVIEYLRQKRTVRTATLHEACRYLGDS